jgi:hypothetical protein
MADRRFEAFMTSEIGNDVTNLLGVANFQQMVNTQFGRFCSHWDAISVNRLQTLSFAVIGSGKDGFQPYPVA